LVDLANVATSDYVPPPNPSTTTEHKTLSVCEDEYTKFLQYQAASNLFLLHRPTFLGP